MTRLTDLQHWIAEQLVRRRALYKDEGTVAAAALRLTGNDRLLPVEQLEIYREQFWLRHTGALLEDFPGVSGVLGQSQWEGLVESYLAQYPSTSWTLRDLGARFVEHVERSAELPHHELCLDMARLEWGYVEIFDAADVAELDSAKLASIPEEAWQNARIVFQPALKLLTVRYDVVALRHKLAGASAVTEIPSAEPASRHLALFRTKDRGLSQRVLEPTAFALLEKLMAGLALVPACEEIAASDPLAAETLSRETGAWFTEWGRLGWVVDVVI